MDLLLSKLKLTGIVSDQIVNSVRNVCADQCDPDDDDCNDPDDCDCDCVC